MGRPGVEKGAPIIGVDYGYLWSRAPEVSDAPQDEVAGEDPPDGVRTSSPVLCGRCSVDRWIFGHLCQAKGDNERNRAASAKELQAGGGKTPYELRVERKFRRPVAPWGQKVWWMSAKKHVSRISAESRWQEGTFL